MDIFMKSCIGRWYILASLQSPLADRVSISLALLRARKLQALCHKASSPWAPCRCPLSLSCPVTRAAQRHVSAAEDCKCPCTGRAGRTALWQSPTLPSCPLPGREARRWPSSVNCIPVGEAEHGDCFLWVNPVSSGSSGASRSPAPGGDNSSQHPCLSPAGAPSAKSSRSAGCPWAEQLGDEGRGSPPLLICICFKVSFMYSLRLVSCSL